MVDSSTVAPKTNNNATNPVGPGDSLTAYLSTTDQFALGQLYSDAILTQEVLDASAVGSDIGVKIAAYQARIKNQAANFQQNLMSGSYGIIAAISGGYNLCALANAAINLSSTDLPEASTNKKARSAASSTFAAVAFQAQSVQVTASTLATKAFVANQSLNQYIGDYGQTLKTLEDDLAHTAKDTLAVIDTLKQDINRNIADIVAGADEAGGAVTGLLIGILTSIATAKSDGPAKDGAKDAAGKDVKKAGDGDAPGSFAVQAIHAVARGESKLSQAGHDLNANNAKLAAAYQSLAAAKQMLAVAKAVGVQTDLFAAMLPLAATSAHDLSVTLQDVQSGLSSFAGTISGLASDAEAEAAAAQAQSAGLSWTALASELHSMKAMLVS